MKKILFFLFLLPAALASAQTAKDTVNVLTDAEISAGTLVDSVRMYFIQGGTWKKQRMDTLAQYVATKVGGVTTFSAGTTGFTPSTATSGAVTLAGTLNVANGGTGATTATQARTNLGLAIGTDVLAPNGSAANLTNFPTFNQSTTGSAASLTTPRDIQVNLASTSAASFNGTANITPGVTGQLAGGNIATGAVGATQLASTAVSAGTYRNARLTVDEDGRLTAANSDTLAMIIACSDETTNITTGNGKVTFRAPFAMTVVGVRSNLNTASTSGIPTVDIMEDTGGGFATILGNKLTIDANELTSLTAATAATITDSAIANDSALRIDVTTSGTGAKGLKVTILYIRP